MTSQLPSRADFGHLRKQARDLQKAHRDGNASCAAVLGLLHRFDGKDTGAILAADISLAQIQFALAMDYGFESWAALKRHVADIRAALGQTVDQTDFAGAGQAHHGKVRDSLLLPGDQRAIVVSDRISAFDYVFGTVPFKGQVLNQLTTWWFELIRDANVVPTHFIAEPDPNISLVKNAQVLPVEIVVRGYLTGSTRTSSWYAYQNLDRKICGIEMPEGMKVNQKFEKPLITPTTKPESGHDENITSEEVVSRGLLTPQLWERAQEYALKLFEYGQEVAAKRGLILVDTKYEMGIDSGGDLIIVDEVHTPDSSRYWVEESYDRRMSAGEPPEVLDKEFFRATVIEKGFDVEKEYTSEELGQFFDDDLRVAASEKYIQLYERFTGKEFVFPDESDSGSRINRCLEGLT